MKIKPGATVALTLAKIEITDIEHIESRIERMSGLFTLEEFNPYEPADYCYDAGWIIYPISDGPDAGRISALTQWEREYGESVLFWISAAELFEQTDPQGYGRSLVQEREQEWVVERMVAQS